MEPRLWYLVSRISVAQGFQEAWTDHSYAGSGHPVPSGPSHGLALTRCVIIYTSENV